MEFNKCIKESFSVIGKEGSTNDGNGFIQKLWRDANENFEEVSHLAKRDNEGNILGIWGAMSDLSGSFKPWEDNFTKGLYLAGVEVNDDAIPPKGWTKWVIPSYEYIYVKCDEDDIFSKVIKYLKDNNLQLVGAVNDFNCPEENGQLYMFFPIRKL
ncbi:GyrI-like domain-containing protein [Clostridium sp. HCS.1]|uniref:GyrI-like domain-containing protein n=1 Tax=Clostridium sp. HCS.1 TaxID=3238594 RepID=UPI003A100AD7